MKNDNFTSKLIQGLGSVGSIVGLIGQYLLRDEFKNLLKIPGDQNFSAFSLGVLVIGTVIIIGLYANRNSLSNKIYLCWPSIKKKYFDDLRDPEKQKGFIQEPFYLDGRRGAWTSVLIATVSFILVLFSLNSFNKSIFYLAFSLSVIFSVTIFLLSLFVFEEWRAKEKERRYTLDEKIKDFFAPKYKELSREEDSSNFLYPAVRQTIEVHGEEYLVVSDLNNPDRFFNVQKKIEAEDSKNEK